MKHTLILLGMLCAFSFIGCTHTEDDPTISPNPPTEDLVFVTFNVNPLAVEVAPISGSSSSGLSVGELVNTIGCAAYDESGKLVVDVFKEHNSTEIPADFGTITATLLPGKYKLLIYGLGKGDGEIIQSFPNEYSSDLGFRKLGDREIFYTFKDIEISHSSSNVDVSLPRISGLLKVEITDEVHPNVGKVVYTFIHYDRWEASSNKGGGNNLIKKEVNIVDGLLENYQYYIPFPSSTINFKISVYDKKNTVLFERNLSLPFEPNKRTIVRGKLFSSLDNKDLEIFIEDTWGEDLEYPLPE